MRQVLRLAKRGEGRVSPNPLVGALIVKNGEIVSRGYHACFGGPHAEVNVLRGMASGSAGDATLYVNLEPCDHHGKTPPCTETILAAGIRRVVVGMEDPNPCVAGKGIRRLRNAGVEVVTGVLESACREINGPYIQFITRNTPYVTLKIAQTLDGKIALPDGRSRWITGQRSRRMVQKLRRAHDAVLVGVGTVIADDPRLTVRLSRTVQPRRIVLDSRLRIPPAARILHLPEPEKTIVVTGWDADVRKADAIRALGVQIWRISRNTSGRIDLDAFLKKAAEAGLAGILVEGGSEVFTSFLREKRIDRMVVFTAPRVFGAGISPFADLGIRTPDEAISFRTARWRKMGSDLMIDARF
ncbi:MAG TPA: bifunctional diaminohydroxyphosphoribosylaminopyrimidine deaminase/5-amino-6-(5-phosphoribosylamino)uracil reductase RibD [bacterium]|nr:bifunctional diaminohydroxyphosphoribosylaminopyrimidine deaminase/5-amino-6-(5-phosphoribosylamino)uracil reductase RibD [bacterium]